MTRRNDRIQPSLSRALVMSDTLIHSTSRDLMAPDTEPSDQELETVMREALAVALERKAHSDEWMRRQLWEAVARARAIS